MRSELVVGATLDAAQVHRLKNQLTIIIGFAELLVDEMADGTRPKADVAEIQRAAQAAVDLVTAAEAATANKLHAKPA